MFKFDNFLAFPPLFPKREIEKILFFFAYLKTFKIFLDLPEVDITINKSFLEPKAFRFLSNNLLKPKSLPHAVIVDVSKARLITAMAFD